MYASHVVSICHFDIVCVGIFVQNHFFAFSPLASYIYLQAPSLSPWSVPTRADGGGGRATNLQKVSTWELTSRQPTIWIRLEAHRQHIANTTLTFSIEQMYRHIQRISVYMLLFCFLYAVKFVVMFAFSCCVCVIHYIYVM